MKAIRALWNTALSFGILIRHRPSFLVIQIGPSLAAMPAIVANIGLRTPFILDSHSGVYLSDREKGFHWLLRIAFRRALAVLIHNDEHLATVKRMGGTPIVLMDPVPTFPDADASQAFEIKHPSVFYPCSWRPDEPIDAVIEAARLVPHVYLYISGRPTRRLLCPNNVILVGFLPPGAYLSALRAADAVLALTDSEGIMLCAAHEAIAVGKPLIVSRTRVLQARFGPAAVVTTLDAPALARAITTALSHRSQLAAASERLRGALDTSWLEQISLLPPEILDSQPFETRAATPTPPDPP
jgi:glycosyltransferase involved in cell wall biosynthesis